MKRAGFTLAELVIVMAIVLMLGAAALSGGMGVLRGLRFNNTFNKIVLMTQQARSFASTGRGASEISAYGIELTEYQIKLFSESSSGQQKTMDTFILDQTQTIKFFAKNSTDNPCNQNAIIRFQKGNGEASFECNGAPDSKPAIIRIGTEEVQNNIQTREKSFVIHRVSGIPQMQ